MYDSGHYDAGIATSVHSAQTWDADSSYLTVLVVLQELLLLVLGPSAQCSAAPCNTQAYSPLGLASVAVLHPSHYSSLLTHHGVHPLLVQAEVVTPRWHLE